MKNSLSVLAMICGASDMIDGASGNFVGGGGDGVGPLNITGGENG
jgi:hypothetical protein